MPAPTQTLAIMQAPPKIDGFFFIIPSFSDWLSIRGKQDRGMMPAFARVSTSIWAKGGLTAPDWPQ
ncbi:hypothetical protein, partial [Aeromonas hydrophila]|uniref:hypothetical protein n=1 Tax=Aeromonas hydrophila TaxID=644 RepID=UPI0036D903AE